MADPFSVSQDALAAFRSETPRIVTETASRSLELTDQVAHHGADAPRLITAGIEFTVKMLDAAMAAGESALLDDELHWALDRLPHDGVLPDHMLSRFALLGEVVKERLPASAAAEVGAAIQWMERRLREIAAGRDPQGALPRAL